MSNTRQEKNRWKHRAGTAEYYLYRIREIIDGDADGRLAVDLIADEITDWEDQHSDLYLETESA